MPDTMLAFHFAKLLSVTKMPDAETASSQVHAATVTSRLRKSFELVSVLTIGSHSRGTSVRAYSDLDLLAVFKKSEAQRGGELLRSTTFIDAVRDDLRQRYQQTQIRRDGQAVAISFGAGSRAVDVVPAIYWAPGPRNWPTYLIPSGDGDWLQTSPRLHSDFINKANEDSGQKLKGVIRLLKFWRHCRAPEVPLLSFHLELVLADGGIGRGASTYSAALCAAFDLLADREARAVRDPLGISGLVPAAKTDAMRIQVASALTYSREHARYAREAERCGDRQEAIRQWSIVFNGHFPTKL